MALTLPSLPCSYGGGSFSFSSLIRTVTRRFSTEYELQQVRTRPPPWHSSCSPLRLVGGGGGQ